MNLKFSLFFIRYEVWFFLGEDLKFKLLMEFNQYLAYKFTSLFLIAVFFHNELNIIDILFNLLKVLLFWVE